MSEVQILSPRVLIGLLMSCEVQIFPIQMYPIIILKPSKEHLLESRHPWIFSGALELSSILVEHGSLVHVVDSKGKIVATGTFSAHSNIAVRVFEFGEATIDEKWLTTKIESAHNRRLLLGYGPDTDTTGYRIVFGEADGIPGLVADRYNDVIVIQLTTAGTDNFLDTIVRCLIDLLNPRAVVERSDIANRREEKLKEQTGALHGSFGDDERVEFRENGIKMLAYPLKGQKTGFYLDQKDTRSVFVQMSKGLRVLNLFSYTGANAIAAIKGGAKSVLNIDSSNWALERSKELAKLNRIAASKMLTEETDVFKWLNSRGDDKFDMVIMDPPAIIKSRKESDDGRKAYHFLNRAAMRLVKSGGLFVTSSCSQFFTVEDFATTLRRASVQNGQTVNVLKVIPQSPDHPVSLYFPESFYLKTFVCSVSKQS